MVKPQIEITFTALKYQLYNICLKCLFLKSYKSIHTIHTTYTYHTYDFVSDSNVYVVKILGT